ncbi:MULTISPECIES: hypothetical protein [Natrialbaceae]|uniref:hypothetical protein n=1 Tax=Natrialbaceae TaxID=1644061 RepID=UPI00207CAAB2|nr:hypothetical protein [Natronococcus sp. CG52]
MSDAETGVQVAGAWLALGSLLLAVSLALHPPPSPDLGEFMASIAESSTLWVAVHWAAALALTVLAIAGLLMLTAGSRLTRAWWTMSAWAVLVVGALWVTTTAVAEATVAGDTATFEAWQIFAEGKAVGFGFLAAAVAVIAVNEARSALSITPAWAAWIGAVAAVAAFIGYVVLGLVLGVAIGGPIWLASAIVMSLWTFWFGAGLARSESSRTEPEEAGTRRARIT